MSCILAFFKNNWEAIVAFTLLIVAFAFLIVAFVSCNIALASLIIAVASLFVLILLVWYARKSLLHKILSDIQSDYRSPKMLLALETLWGFYRECEKKYKEEFEIKYGNKINEEYEKVYKEKSKKIFAKIFGKVYINKIKKKYEDKVKKEITIIFEGKYRTKINEEVVKEYEKKREKENKKVNKQKINKKIEYIAGTLHHQRRLVSQFYNHLATLYVNGILPKEIVFDVWVEANLRIIPQIIIPIEDKLRQVLYFPPLKPLDDKCKLKKLYNGSKKYGKN